MKIFDFHTESDDSPKTLKITDSITDLIISVSKQLKLSLETLHFSLLIFHCQAKIATFQKFDRFIYSCASILIATKLTEALRYPIQIVKQMRMVLSNNKKQELIEEEMEMLKKMEKKVFEAEIKIMINIGFDFDLEIALSCLGELSKQVHDDGLVEKVRQTLTSLYKTRIVIYFPSQLLAICALDIVMKNEDLNMMSSGFTEELVQMLKKPEVQQIKSGYLSRCYYN